MNIEIVTLYKLTTPADPLIEALVASSYFTYNAANVSCIQPRTHYCWGLL